MKNIVYLSRRPHASCVHSASLLLLTSLTCLAGSPPVIKPSSTLSSQAVFTGSSAVFTVGATGDAPLRYQWRRDGQDLASQTNRALNLKVVQAADDGAYDVVVSNSSGTATSYGVHLHVVPPSRDMTWGSFTNTAGLRLPYRFYLPPGYDSSRRYPLIVQLHGSSEPPIDESTFATYFPAQFYSHTSHGRQNADPAIVLYPTRRRGDGSWTDSYVKLIADCLDEWIGKESIDTNRVYLIGTSEGVHAAWDLLGQRPALVAAAGLAAGWKGTAPPSNLMQIPTWVWQAADDADVSVSNSRALVRALRLASGQPIYTEFQTGGHVGGMGAGLLSPSIHHWLMEQRLGVAPRSGPRLKILAPAGDDLLTTAATTLDLSGTAEDYEGPVTRVTWENLVTGSKGDAVGSHLWEAEGIPLIAGVTNLVMVSSSTASGAPANGGVTTATQTKMVLCSPIRATLAVEQTQALLKWTGGSGVVRVQRATDIGLGDWQDYSTNATSPLILNLGSPLGFYRIVAQ